MRMCQHPKKKWFEQMQRLLFCKGETGIRERLEQARKRNCSCSSSPTAAPIASLCPAHAFSSSQ